MSDPLSSFNSKNPVSTMINPSVPIFGSSNPEKDKTRNRFKYDSLPKSIIKKNFGTETKHLGFVPSVSSFQQKQPLSTSTSCPVALIGSGDYEKGLSADRFKYDSLPKEIIEKNFGTETRHLGFTNPASTFADHKPLSTDPRAPAAPFGGQSFGEQSQKANRFKYDSLDKEIVKKQFGTETSHLGYYNAYTSTMSPKQPLSHDRSPNVTVMGTGFDKTQNIDRFKYDSLPKEIIRKNFGTETAHLGFYNKASTLLPHQPSSLDRSPVVAVIGPGFSTEESMKANRFTLDSYTAANLAGQDTKNIGYHCGIESKLRQNTFSFGHAPEQRKYNTNTQVNDDILWRAHVSAEIQDRIDAGQYDASSIEMANTLSPKQQQIAAHKKTFGPLKLKLPEMVKMMQQKINEKCCSINSMSLAAFKLFGCGPSYGGDFTCDSSGITFDMFSSTLDGWGMQLSKNESQALFDYLDMSGSGTITFKEFKRSVQPSDFSSTPWYYEREKMIFDEMEHQKKLRRSGAAGDRSSEAGADKKKDPGQWDLKKKVTGSDIARKTPSSRMRLTTPQLLMSTAERNKQGLSAVTSGLPSRGGVGSRSGLGSSGGKNLSLNSRGGIGTSAGTGSKGRLATGARTAQLRTGTGANRSRGRTGTASQESADGAKKPDPLGLGSLAPTVTAAPAVHYMKITMEDDDRKRGEARQIDAPPLPSHMASKGGATIKQPATQQQLLSPPRKTQQLRTNNADAIVADSSTATSITAQTLQSPAAPEVKFLKSADTIEDEQPDEGDEDDRAYEERRLQLRLQLRQMRQKNESAQKVKLEKAKVPPWAKFNEDDDPASSRDSSRSWKQVPGDFIGSAHWVEDRHSR